MAQGVVFNLAGKVLELLSPLIREEIKLACGVKADLVNLESTVSIIKDVLLDAEKQAHHRAVVKGWLEKLQDVLHDADDVLDEFSTEALQRNVMAGNKMTKEVRIFFSSSNQLAFSLKMGHKIKAIRERLDVIKREKDDFHFIQNSVEPQVMNRDRETYSFVLEEDVVGREDDKNKIINLLLDSNTVENVSIIPIVGIGGLGKTTLAQFIYNDEIVKNNFELMLWICVSDNFDLKHIVKQILESLGNRRDEESLEVLQNHLRRNLNGKKYFIVLDDLWNEDKIKWIPLKNLLMGGARGSKIVVTTRSIKVAEITGTTSPHKLEGLDPEKAWSLFVKKAFIGGIEPENKYIIAIGKEIVKKCIGVPLAIRTIGSVLYRKTSEIEWQSFLDTELSILTQQESDISPTLTLKLSYDHLPSHLKQCFAYCRLFPKDYRIDVVTLINLWAAQGFIVLEGPRQGFMDIGKKYFMELLWKNFFKDVEMDKLGNITSCKIYDLVYDLAIHVAGTQCTILNSSVESVYEKARHVSLDFVDSSMQFFVDSSMQFSSIPRDNRMKIQTILVSSVGGKLGNLTCDALLLNSNYLRTLDLSDLGLSAVPSSIGDLKHLRYLDVSKNYGIKILPNSIGKLLNLQTLKLNSCLSLIKLPRGIKKLINLRCLEITGCCKLTHMPIGIGHLASIERLPEFVVSKEGLKARSCGVLSELRGLNNLGGSLRIAVLGHGEDDALECKATNVKEKEHLQELRLVWDSEWAGETECYDEMLMEGLQPHPNLKALELYYYMGLRIPSWFSSHVNLVHFELSSNRRLKYLPPLNQLPFLKSVDISTMVALEYISEDTTSSVFGSSERPFFPSLSSLRIRYCPSLKGWCTKEDDNEPDYLLLPSFPVLLKLEIRGCPNLTSMPMFPNLKEKLILDKISSKVLQLTLCMEVAHSQFPLSSLESLELWHVNDLESLPEEWLQNLVSLRALFIYKCDGLRSLPLRSFQLLTSLRYMEIWDCNEFSLLDGEDDGMHWQGLRKLLSLDFEGIPNLVSLPNGLQHVTTLQILKILNCPNLNALPEWIGNLTSLAFLQIWKCPKVKSLPLGIGHLSSLSTLYISNIPKMEELPGGISDLRSLKSLHIENLPNVTSLPQGISNLTSLYNLTISDCANLASLPPGIRDLGSLQNLLVRGCPLLSQTYED